MRFSIPPPMLTMRTLSVLISRFLFSRSRFLRVFCVAEFCVCPYNRAQNVTRWGEMITRENERSDESSFFFFLSSFALVWLKKNLTFPLSSVVLKSGHKKQNLVVSAQESSQEEISASRFFSLSLFFFFLCVCHERGDSFSSEANTTNEKCTFLRNVFSICTKKKYKHLCF